MSNTAYPRRRLWAGLLSVALLGCGTTGQGLPPGASVMAVSLPSPRHEAAVFSDGQVVYVAGGLDDKSTALAQIVRYNPAAGTLAVMADVLPTATYAAGVVWTGSAAYLFGGLGLTTVLGQIVRYVPASGATIMTAKMPIEAYNVAAVWTGSMVYVFGGQQGGSLTQILAYDPATDSLSTLASTLAVGVEAPAVFWDGHLVWILGGNANNPTRHALGTDIIQTFDPKSGQVQSIGHLPYGVWDTPSFTDGRKYYLPGGYNTSTSGYTSITAFDPVDRSSSLLSFVVPVRLAGRVGTWVSSVGAAYFFGGADNSTGVVSDKIIRIVP